MWALGCLPAARGLLFSSPLGFISAEVAGPVPVGSVGGLVRLVVSSFDQ